MKPRKNELFMGKPYHGSQTSFWQKKLAVPRIILWSLAALFFYFYLTGEFEWNSSKYGVDTRLGGLLLCLATLLPTYLYIRSPERLIEPIPFVPMVGIIFGAYYGLPVLLPSGFYPLMRSAVTQESLHAAVWISFWGWLCFMFGFYCIDRRIVRLDFWLSKKPELIYKPISAKRMAIGLIVFSFCLDMFNIVNRVPSFLKMPVTFAMDFGQIGIGMLAMLSLRGHIKGTLKILLWVAVIPAFVFLQMHTGAISKFIHAGIFIGLLVWACGKRFPWLALFVVMALAIMFKNSMVDFRSQYWGQKTGASRIAKATSLVKFTSDKITDLGAENYREQLKETTSSRINMLSLFSHALVYTPQSIPYWNGHSYLTLPASFIPRFLWPDKPSKTVGNDFGHRYSLLHVSDISTSVNLPQLVEFYVNFGIPGVLLGMYLLGLFYRVLSSNLNTTAAGDGVTLISTYLFCELLNIESDFSLVHGLILQKCIIIYFLIRPVCTSSAEINRMRESQKS